VGTVEIAAAFRTLLQEQIPSIKDDRLGALDFRKDWGFHIETAFYPIAWSEMGEFQIDVCGKCGAEIHPARRVDFTLKDETRVREACFVKATPRAASSRNDWSN
jgi:hypothetical protein